ncbi:synaptobrevin homolog YKT6-like [Homarus americanus]|uniref:Synaptobrevin YKT6-like n=1 Tax=Homarus americanus TaxID=6706 RepID=A0A8J5MGG6_HOMAM|nr:synaptobrevin homolog YKT6-like [Homarus americanus]KAG7153321.1 Synaptobrevin YKT6-like [Homarus americanus]
MVKLFAVCVLYKGTERAHLLKTAYDLSQFSFFQRGSVQEFMAFTSKIITERSNPCSRQSVKEQEYMCHVYVRADNLAGVVISDHEYQYRVAHNMLNRIIDDFAAKVPSHLWPDTEESAIPYTELPATLARWQNPREADSLTKVQEEVEETKIILHKTINAVLERGEKLDDLVSKSENLSMQSKTFYKTARKTNSCCTFG